MWHHERHMIQRSEVCRVAVIRSKRRDNRTKAILSSNEEDAEDIVCAVFCNEDSKNVSVPPT